MSMCVYLFIYLFMKTSHLGLFHSNLTQGIYINCFTLAFLLKIHAFTFTPEMGILWREIPFELWLPTYESAGGEAVIENKLEGK